MTQSMFSMPEDIRAELEEHLDALTVATTQRADEFLRTVDEERDRTNSAQETLTDAEIERRDLVNAISQLSADMALLPVKFLETNREALLRNGPDLIFLVADMLSMSAEGMQRAVMTYQGNVYSALNRDQDNES